MKRTITMAAFLAFSFLTVACGSPPLERRESALSFLITNQRHDMVDNPTCGGIPYVVETTPDTTVGPTTVQMRGDDFLATSRPTSNAVAIDCDPSFPLANNGQVFYNDAVVTCGMRMRRAHGAFGPRTPFSVPLYDLQFIPADSPACPSGNPNGVWRMRMPDCHGGSVVKGWSF